MPPPSIKASTKFPRRKKRGSITAHTAATSPFGLSPALASVRDLNDQLTGIQPEHSTSHLDGQLRRRRRSSNLRADIHFDANLDDAVSEHRMALAFFPAPVDGYRLPAIIITPPTPSRRVTQELAEQELSSSGTQSSETLPRSSSLSSLTSLTSLSSLSTLSSITTTKILPTIKSVASKLWPSRLRRATGQVSRISQKEDTDEANGESDADTVEPEEPANQFLAPPPIDYELGRAW